MLLEMRSENCMEKICIYSKYMIIKLTEYAKGYILVGVGKLSLPMWFVH